MAKQPTLPGVPAAETNGAEAAASREPEDAELALMRLLAKRLKDLDGAARARVLAWACDRYAGDLRLAVDRPECRAVGLDQRPLVTTVRAPAQLTTGSTAAG